MNRGASRDRRVGVKAGEQVGGSLEGEQEAGLRVAGRWWQALEGRPWRAGVPLLPEAAMVRRRGQHMYAGRCGQADFIVSAQHQKQRLQRCTRTPTPSPSLRGDGNGEEERDVGTDVTMRLRGGVGISCEGCQIGDGSRAS